MLSVFFLHRPQALTLGKGLEENPCWLGRGGSPGPSPGTRWLSRSYLFPVAAAPARGRLPSALVSWCFCRGRGPGRTGVRVPTSQTPPCPSSGLDTCSALGDLGVEGAGAWGPRLMCPQLAGAPGPLARAPSAGHAGSGERGGLGLAVDVLALYTLPSKGSSDLPLQSRERMC